MITLMGILGYHWGKKWVEQGLITEEEMYNIGYIGCFFAKIVGF